jgi:hypothetical protein
MSARAAVARAKSAGIAATKKARIMWTSYFFDDKWPATVR